MAVTDVNAILSKLTLEEKVRRPNESPVTFAPNFALQISLLAGRDFWETVPIPEKGIPALKVGTAMPFADDVLTFYRLAMARMVPVELPSPMAQPPPAFLRPAMSHLPLMSILHAVSVLL